MNSSSVVLLEKDPGVALSLVRLLQNQFDVIRIETSCDSLREGIFKQRALRQPARRHLQAASVLGNH